MGGKNPLLCDISFHLSVTHLRASFSRGATPFEGCSGQDFTLYSEHREWCQISREAVDGTECAVCSVTGAQGARVCVCVCAAGSQHPAVTAASQRRPHVLRCALDKTQHRQRGSRHNEQDRAESTWTSGPQRDPPLRGRDYIISASDPRSPQRAVRGWLPPISLVSKKA